ncbi:MAG: lytic transglycosylase domain-containing protein [Rhodospirillaceae bacterium]|nr:lytic transglycosylase domain-containing protein [Rhodospirillaceae bacterium]
MSVAALVVGLWPVKAMPAGALPAHDRATAAAVYAAAVGGRWAEARKLSAGAHDPLLGKFVDWLHFVQPRSNARFEDIAAFFVANPDWPDMTTLLRRAEEALEEQTPDRLVLSWFANRKPLTTDGAIRLAAALASTGESEKAKTLVRETWVQGVFGDKQEKHLLTRYRGWINAEDHVARLDRTLWEGRRSEARRMLPRVDADHRAVADARLKLMDAAPGVDGALKRIPASLQNDPGLLFDRARWRRKKGQDDAARQILLNVPDLGRPEAWVTERSILARRALTVGNISEAYHVARDHRLSSGTAWADAEWLSGWIALRFLNDPAIALPHFTKLYEATRLPVSRARGAYWAGRAADAIGDLEGANLWFARAASYFTTFYGQLAASRVPADAVPTGEDRVMPTEAQRAAFNNLELVRAVRLLSELGDRDYVRPFVLRLTALAQTPTDHALVIEIGESLGRLDLAVAAAKRSIQSGVLLVGPGYPIIRLDARADLEPPLVLATIRQESAFEGAAVSSAGARGLMQLMPSTAKAVAKELGLPYTDRMLTTDESFNIRLGTAHLADLIDGYDGSYVLALAAYNAGGSRVRQWLREIGDPRRADTDVIDWIEAIPFEETRNYIQRVLENLHVYRRRLGEVRYTSDRGFDTARWR